MGERRCSSVGWENGDKAADKAADERAVLALT